MYVLMRCAQTAEESGLGEIDRAVSASEAKGALGVLALQQQGARQVSRWRSGAARIGLGLEWPGGHLTPIAVRRRSPSLIGR